MTVHIDAEDDEHIEDREAPYPIPPPGRHVRSQLIQTWQSTLSSDDIKKMTLHYLNNTVSVELFLDKDKFEASEQDSETLKNRLMEQSSELPWLRRVTVWYG